MINHLVKEAFAAVQVVAFKEDLAPQVILLMGLPAAGKSTFIKKSMAKYYNHRMPHAGAFQTINSDAQVRQMQYERARRDFASLRGTSIDDWRKITTEMTYTANDGHAVHFPISHGDFQAMDFKTFWLLAYKPYYASYFGERAKAKELSDDQLETKVRSGDVVIFDSTGTAVSKFLQIFAKAKEHGHTTSVIWLDIPAEYCIARDKYRGETEGRSVGASTILSYVPKLPSAYKAYTSSDLVDRFLHFKWQGEVIKGAYHLAQDVKRYPKRGATAAAAAFRR
jgi:predicted kinase